MDLSIVIVNWKSKDYVLKCLESIRRHTTGLDYEIIVIDGGSFDGCGALLAAQEPEVIFIQHPDNVGFPRANNLAFARARGDYLLFLNPDTELLNPAINILHQAARTLPRAGVVGARLLNTDDSLQTSCVQSYPTILNQILDVEFLRRRFPSSSLWGMAPLFTKSSEPSPVEAISGACMMMRRALFEEVGLFSKDYFMYSEDIDLCRKAQVAGRVNYYVSTARVRHHGGGSTRQEVSRFSTVMLVESISRYLRKFRGGVYSRVYRLSLGFCACVRLLAVAMAWPLSRFGIIRQNVRSARSKWLSILWWSLGLETWVRKY